VEVRLYEHLLRPRVAIWTGGGGKNYCKGWKPLTTLTQGPPQAHRHLDSRLLISFTAILVRPVSSRKLKSFKNCLGFNLGAQHAIAHKLDASFCMVHVGAFAY